MRLRTGMIIKHEAFMDVAFWVDKCHGPFGKSGKLKVRGRWINMGFIQSYHIGITQKFEILAKEYDKWFKCLEPEAKCIRYAKWKKFK